MAVSAVHSGKAIAAMLTNEGDVLDYVEIIGGGKPIAHQVHHMTTHHAQAPSRCQAASFSLLLQSQSVSYLASQ